MNEEQLYAAIGRKQEALDNLNAEYDRLLVVLEKVVSGEIEKERVAVSLSGRSWKVDQKPEEQKAE